MTITLLRRDPLLNVNKGSDIHSYIDILQSSESHIDRKNAAGWLRGAWDVLRRNPKHKVAADYIDEIVKAYRYAGTPDVAE